MDCQLCSAGRARYRGYISDHGMDPRDVDAGVPLPNGDMVTWLCDACDELVSDYWLTRERDGEAAL